MSGVVDVLRLGTYQRFLAGAVCSGVGVWIFQTALYWAALQSGTTGSVGILVAVISLPSLLLTIPAGFLTDRAGPFWLLLIGQVAPALMCVGGIAFVAADGHDRAGARGPRDVRGRLRLCALERPRARLRDPHCAVAPDGQRDQPDGAAVRHRPDRRGRARGLPRRGRWRGLALAVSAAVFGLGALTVLTLPRIEGLETRSGSSVRGMLEAVRWLRHAPATLVLVVLSATASLLAYAYIPLLGALSRDVIGAGSAGLGTLTSTSGIGMVASALTANSLGARLRRGRSVSSSCSSARSAWRPRVRRRAPRCRSAS